MMLRYLDVLCLIICYMVSFSGLIKNCVDPRCRCTKSVIYNLICTDFFIVNVSCINMRLARGYQRRTVHTYLNTLWSRQNRRHFADDIFKCIFLNENVWISINTSLKFVRKGPTNHIPALFQIMAWCRPGDKLLSEPMMISLPTHIYVTRPQRINNEQ